MSRCSLPALWALAWFAGAGTAVAQPANPASAALHTHASPPGAASTASAPSAPAPSNALGYRSVFEGYRLFKDEPVGPWREANDLVARIGGWQAYAREIQGGPTAGSASAPAAQATEAMPAGHAGHGDTPMTPGTAPQAPKPPASGAHSGHHS